MFGGRYEWLIGLRYLRAKRSQHFISVITLLSMGGVALGVAALIVVLAVMTGFREELQKQILGVTGHVTVRAFSGNLNNYRWVIGQIKGTERMVAAAPYVTGQSMLNSSMRTVGVGLRGIDPDLDKAVSSLAKNMVSGSLDKLSDFGIVLGKHLANNLGVDLGDKVTVLVAMANVTAMGAIPRMKRFTVAGLFDSGMYEYDSSLAYIHLQDAQTLYRMGTQEVTGIEVTASHADMAFGVRSALAKKLGGAYWVQDWMQMNLNFFRALGLEKATMFVILFLVVLVAAFNIVSSLVMVVMEKGREIAILKTMGATSLSIMSIFIINGGVVGIVGTGLGLVLGLALAFNLEAALGFIERLFGVHILSGDVYYIDHLPALVLWNDVYWIASVSLLISLVATLYPAWRAAAIDPVESLRYE